MSVCSCETNCTNLPQYCNNPGGPCGCFPCDSTPAPTCSLTLKVSPTDEWINGPIGTAFGIPKQINNFIGKIIPMVQKINIGIWGSEKTPCISPINNINLCGVGQKKGDWGHFTPSCLVNLGCHMALGTPRIQALKTASVPEFYPIPVPIFIDIPLYMSGQIKISASILSPICESSCSDVTVQNACFVISAQGLLEYPNNQLALTQLEVTEITNFALDLHVESDCVRDSLNLFGGLSELQTQAENLFNQSVSGQTGNITKELQAMLPIVLAPIPIQFPDEFYNLYTMNPNVQVNRIYDRSPQNTPQFTYPDGSKYLSCQAGYMAVPPVCNESVANCAPWCKYSQAATLNTSGGYDPTFLPGCMNDNTQQYGSDQCNVDDGDYHLNFENWGSPDQWAFNASGYPPDIYECNQAWCVPYKPNTQNQYMGTPFDSSLRLAYTPGYIYYQSVAPASFMYPDNSYSGSNYGPEFAVNHFAKLTNPPTAYYPPGAQPGNCTTAQNAVKICSCDPKCKGFTITANPNCSDWSPQPITAQGTAVYYTEEVGTATVTYSGNSSVYSYSKPSTGNWTC